MDDLEATLNLEERTWTFTTCIQTTFMALPPHPHPPPSYAHILPYPHVHYGKLLFPSPCHYSYITTHHIIIHA